MWTFPVILSLTILTLFPTVWIVHGMSNGFWQWSITHAHILIGMETRPEIDTAVYAASLGIGICIFFILFQLASHLKREPWFDRAVAGIGCAGAAYLLMLPRADLFSLHQLQPICALISGGMAVLVSRMRKPYPYLIEGVVALVIVRYSMRPMVQLDMGNKLLYSTDDYLRYGVPHVLAAVVLGLLILAKRRVRMLDSVASWCTGKRISVLLWGSITLSLLYLMTKSHHPSDIFFTLLPAYHALHSGTLLVSVVSQYGLLYLTPWILWLAAFPRAPVSFQVGAFVSMLLLSGYFAAYIRVVRVLVQRRILFILTVTASYYFTVLVRYSSFSDMVSVVSTPAFTPLRFGMFIIPLWFLIRLQKSGKDRYFMLFMASSAALFFYSFEIGTGLSAAAILVCGIRASTKPNARSAVLRGIGVYAGTLLASVLLLCAYTFVSAGVLPDFSSYWYLAKLYGSGFLTVPIGSQTAGFLPLGISLAGLIVGVTRLVKDKKSDGLLWCYLAIIELVMFPYYTGRSMNQTLYSISLPFILLCAGLIEYAVPVLRKDRRRFSVWSLIAVCGMVLVIGWSRGSGMLLRTVADSPGVLRNAALYLRNAFSVWEIRHSGQYAFLSEHLPGGCPLVAFDDKEFELPPALHVPPAFQYAFIYGFVTTKEQIDMLMPHARADRVCVFVSDRFLKKQDIFSYGAYRYFFGKYQPYLQVIASDPHDGFILYELPAGAFAQPDEAQYGQTGRPR